MGDHLHPPDKGRTQVKNATIADLRKSPEDMPDRGGSLGGEAQTRNATTVSLGRSENMIAQNGMRPGMGETQTRNATTAPLSRKFKSPYGGDNPTDGPSDYKKS